MTTRRSPSKEAPRARIGVISDTHGLFDGAIRPYFAGVDRILHAGDIGRPPVLDRLRAIAPVTAVSGNVDGFEASGVPREHLLTIGGYRIALYHRLYEGGSMTEDGRRFLERVRADVCVFGHTHQPTIRWVDGVLLFNPGSAGPKRFRLPRGIGLLLIYPDRVEPMQIVLPDRTERDLA